MRRVSDNAINEDIPGYMSSYELDILAQWASSLPENSTVVELGSFLGRSAWVWAQNTSPSCHLFFIDNWVWSGSPSDFSYISPEPDFGYQEGLIDIYNSFLKNMPDHREFQMIRGWIPDEVNWNHGEIDVLFIDDDHTYDQVMKDMDYFGKFFSDRVLICGHDFNKEAFPGVVKAVEKLAKQWDRELNVVPYTSLWYLEPKGWTLQYDRPEDLGEDHSVISNGLLEQFRSKIYQILSRG